MSWPAMWLYGPAVLLGISLRSKRHAVPRQAFTFSPEAGEACDDQARVLLEQLLRVQPKPFEDARTERINEDICAPSARSVRGTEQLPQ